MGCRQGARRAHIQSDTQPDEQRGRRPILDMLVARALKNSQLICGERHAYSGDRTLAGVHKNLRFSLLFNELRMVPREA